MDMIVLLVQHEKGSEEDRHIYIYIYSNIIYMEASMVGVKDPTTIITFRLVKY